MAHAIHQPPPHTSHSTDVLMRGVLGQFPELEMASLFGPVIRGQAHAHCDLDLSVRAKQAFIEALAAAFGRPVDPNRTASGRHIPAAAIFETGPLSAGERHRLWPVYLPALAEPRRLRALSHPDIGGKAGHKDRVVFDQNFCPA